MSGIIQNMPEYPQLGGQVSLSLSWTLARARKNLILALMEIFRKRFQTAGCIWKTSEGRWVLILGRQTPWRADIPVAPIVDLPSPDPCHSSRIKASTGYVPHFPLQADGRICYVDLRKSYLLPISHLQEFAGRLAAGSRELAGMELSRRKTGHDFLSWMNV